MTGTRSSTVRDGVSPRRWWVDGLLFAGLGAFCGLCHWFWLEWDPWFSVGGYALGFGVFGAVFGRRVIDVLQYLI